MGLIFTDRERTEWSASRQGETSHAFLDRSAQPIFAAVRHLLEDWLTRVPAEHQADLIGAFRADNQQFDSAFWALYLHELYLRAGYDVEIHPEVPNSPKHPDFRMTGKGEPFYLEAVQVGTPTSDLAERRRMEAAHDAMNGEATEQFSLSMTHAQIGPNPLSARRLRQELRRWLAGLDPATVVAALSEPERPGELTFDRLPRFTWRHDGWDLEFHALPLSPDAARGDTPMIGMYGPATAQMIDKHTGLSRALDSKANKYGELDAPLVIAVLDNTGPSLTKDYQVEQALFGLAAAPPAVSATEPEGILQGGHWLGRSGWRRGHAPQVIAAMNFAPWDVAKFQPRLWETLEPGRKGPKQPDFLARVDVGGRDPQILPAGANPFGLPDGWPGEREFR